MHDLTRSFLPWDGDFEALYAEGGPLSHVPPNNQAHLRERE